MADYGNFMRKLLGGARRLEPVIAEEAPQVERVLAQRAAQEAPEVIGEGTSKLASSMDNVAEAELANPQLALPAPDAPPVGAMPDSKTDPQGFLNYIKNNKGKLAAAGLLTAGTLGYVNSGDEQPPQDPSEEKAPASLPPEQKPLIPKTEAPVVKKAIASSKAPSKSPASDSSGLNTIDMGKGGIDTEAGLKAAQDAANIERSGAMNGRLGDILGGAISGSGPQNQQLFKDMEANADQRVKDFKDQVAAQADNPNSPLANGFKEYAKKLGFELKGNMSLNQAKDLMPMLFKGFEAEEARKANKENLAYKYKELGTIAKIKGDEKKQASNQKRFDTLGKALTSETSSSRSAFGKAANNKRSAEAILALVDQVGGDYNQIDNRQMQEIARSLDALLSQGSATISGTEHLVPKTIRGNMAKTMEYLTNSVHGAGGADFIKRMVETVHREKELADDQIKRTQGKILAPYKNLQQEDPEQYNEILQSHGLDTSGEESDESKSETPRSSQPSKVQKPKPVSNETRVINGKVYVKVNGGWSPQ